MGETFQAIYIQVFQISLRKKNWILDIKAKQTDDLYFAI